VLKRAFEYWHNIDEKIGDRIAKGVDAGISVPQDELAPAK
jgi:hypothetical protein